MEQPIFARSGLWRKPPFLLISDDPTNLMIEFTAEEIMRSRWTTREELHGLVWEKPLTEVAKQFEITATGLAKVCDRNGIPRPPQGYWIKLEHGKTTGVIPLPPAENAPQHRIEIVPQAKRRVRQSSPVKKPVEGPAAVVLDDFHDLHVRVSEWVSQHRTNQAERDHERRRASQGDRWGFVRAAISDLTESDRYRFRATSTLFRAIEQAGIGIEDSQITGEFSILVGSHALKCVLVEKMLQSGRELDRSWSAYPSHHQHGLHPSGFLRFAVRTYVDGSNRRWVENSRKKMEVLIPAIVDELQACGPRLDEIQAERERLDREYREQKRRREDQQQRREQEERRWAQFQAKYRDWEKAAELRRFIDEIEQRTSFHALEVVDGRSVQDWIEWTKRRIEEADPLNGDLRLLWKTADAP